MEKETTGDTNSVDATVFEQLGSNAFFSVATEECAVRQDDHHHAVLLKKMKTVQEKGEIGGGFRRESVVF